MKQALLVNGHQPYEGISPGTLNAAFVEQAADHLAGAGFEVIRTEAASGWDNEVEIRRILASDILFFQFPINSMGVTWLLKKYLDEVFTAGMDGRLSTGDGRTRSDPSRQYGTGGLLNGKRYMLSTTLNAPRFAFEDDTQTFFAGSSVDDLLYPIHLNFRFFGLTALPTFAAYDVKKNLDFEADQARLNAMLTVAFPR
ncbi:MAG: NAD(P)H-dependent oxidoreductase [Pseudomonadota bacterium]